MKRYLSVMLFISLSACGDAMTYPAELAPEAKAADALSAKTPVSQIQVVSDDTINNGKFTVMGPVKATVGKLTVFHPTPTVEQANEKLRIEAAELGADAVIGAQISDVTICALSWGCRKASGTAVSLMN